MCPLNDEMLLNESKYEYSFLNNLQKKGLNIQLELWPKVVMGALYRLKFQVETVAVKGQSEMFL